MLMAGLVLVPAGGTMALDTGTTELDAIETDVAVSTTLEELRTLVDDLSLANEGLQSSNASLQQTVDTLSHERDSLLASLGRFDQLYDPLEADRQILLELRKGLPETRPEAEAQLARLRSLALTSDPARLTLLIDRIDDTAPAFLDWRFGEFDTPAEFSEAYVDTGANAFDAASEEFRSEVLMSVASRLDGLLTTLDRAR
jgi:hypothetical protein